MLSIGALYYDQWLCILVNVSPVVTSSSRSTTRLLPYVYLRQITIAETKSTTTGVALHPSREAWYGQRYVTMIYYCRGRTDCRVQNI